MSNLCDNTWVCLTFVIGNILGGCNKKYLYTACHVSRVTCQSRGVTPSMGLWHTVTLITISGKLSTTSSREGLGTCMYHWFGTCMYHCNGWGHACITAMVRGMHVSIRGMWWLIILNVMSLFASAHSVVVRLRDSTSSSQCSQSVDTQYCRL